MTIGIMQPYFMPYIGYFQLIKAVDRFIIYDDVNYINKGWINRNNILVGEKAHLFTIPLQDASQNKLINEVLLATDLQWKKKLLKTIQQSYQKAPLFPVIFPMLEELIESASGSIADLATRSIQAVAGYLSLPATIIPSSSIYDNRHVKAQERIIDICKKEGANHYINPIGGQELYSSPAFADHGLKLSFIQTNSITYRQFKTGFVPWLSVIDVLMFNEPDAIQELLDNYTLI